MNKDKDYASFEERAATLTQQRNLKMARSAHAYVRGSTLKFYEWLDTDRGSKVPKGPAVWICGDCHIGNLGPVANANGEIAVQIRDLDQTVVGNPAHDLIRLGLSLAMAARGSDLPGVITAKMLEQIMAGYEQAFTAQDEDAECPQDPPESVARAMKQALKRKWKHLACERIEDITPKIPLGKRFWPVTKEEREAIKGLVATEEVRHLATLMRSRPDDASVEMIDAAYWMKGCSSLGRLRYAVLLRIGRKECEYCLMDIKEAGPALAPRYKKSAMPRNNAERIVTGARAISPYLGERMLPAKLLGKSVFLRELLPQDLKLDIEHLTQEEATRVAYFLAYVTGAAHARQMDERVRERWRTELNGSHTKSLEAPSWLWSSIVDLIGSHEEAYLEHCRKYAFNM